MPEETDPQDLREEAQGLTAKIQAAKVLEDTDSLAKVLGEIGNKCVKAYPYYACPCWS